MPSANPWPSEVRLNPARDVLTVAFDNGARFGLRAEYLRVESPSAEVRNHGGPKTIVMGKEQVKIAGLEPVGNTPAEFAAVIRRETPEWAKVIRDAGIKLGN